MLVKRNMSSATFMCLTSKTHNVWRGTHCCQLAIAGCLDHMCLALWASGLWPCYAALQNLIPSFPWIAPPRPPPWRNPREGRDQILPSGNHGQTAMPDIMCLWSEAHECRIGHVSLDGHFLHEFIVCVQCQKRRRKRSVSVCDGNPILFAYGQGSGGVGLVWRISTIQTYICKGTCTKSCILSHSKTT